MSWPHYTTRSLALAPAAVINHTETNAPSRCSLSQCARLLAGQRLHAQALGSSARSSTLRRIVRESTYKRSIRSGTVLF